MTDFPETRSILDMKNIDDSDSKPRRYTVPIHRGNPPNQWHELLELAKTRSLRQLARDFGTSHEAVRRAKKAAERVE
jgi:hypothetical protein